MFTTFTNHMDTSVKNMLKVCTDQTQKYQNHFKREHQMVGKAFIQLGAALQQDGIIGSVHFPDLQDYNFNKILLQPLKISRTQ